VLEDSRLLDAHLANCERCVEHERRLVQEELLEGETIPRKPPNRKRRKRPCPTCRPSRSGWAMKVIS